MLLLLLTLRAGSSAAQAPVPTRTSPTTPVAAPAPRPAGIPAQRPLPNTQNPKPTPSRPAPPDTLRVPLGRRAGKRDIETTIVYSARDSIRLDAPGKVAYLYGDASITYGTTHLEAALVRIEYGQNMVVAEGAPDSTGQLTGTPIFTDKGEQYEAKKIAYNFKTKKGKISEAITKQGDGYIHAEAVKRVGDKELYGLHGQYTTCELPHPHFYINASRMKVVPGEKIVTGPFNLVIADIPTPLGFLFGYFPTPKTRSSGIIIPSYGEAARRGFFLTEGGYYWAASDHVGVRLTGDFWTLGGWAARGNVQYRTRYKYDGSLLLSFSRQPKQETTGEAVSLNSTRGLRPGDQVNIRWSHTPTARPGKGNFSANVDAGSSGFYQTQANASVQNRLTTSFASTIQYQKTPAGTPFNYTISARQAQSVEPSTGTTTMNFDLPNAAFGVAQQTPLRWLTRRTGRSIYSNLTASYSVSAANSFSTVRSGRDRITGLLAVGEPRTQQNLSLERDGLGAILRNGAPSVRHNIGVGLGSYSLAHLIVSPNVTYNEQWEFVKQTYRFDPDSQAVRIERQRGLYRIYSYSYGVATATHVYALLRLPKKARLEAVRSDINPGIGYSYTPDFGAARYGYYQTGVRTDSTDRLSTLRRYAGVPGSGSSSSVSFRLSANLEAKVRPAAGDTATKSRKVSLINQMSVSTNYNFLADSLRLSNIVTSLNTRLFDLIDLNGGATFSAYQRDTLGREIDRFLLEAPGRKLGRLLAATVTIGFQFNSAARRAGTPQQAAQSGVLAMPGQPQLVTNNPLNTATGLANDYVAFEQPWTLNANLSLTYNAPKPRRRGAEANLPLIQTQTLLLNGTVQLTKKWAITYFTPLDLKRGRLVSPTFGVARNLHCWMLSVNATPVGDYASYTLNLGVNPGVLQDLKIARNRGYYQ